MRRDAGFTLIELISIVVILAIMAVVALPRLGDMEYRSQEFRDRVVSALRYAQKSAVSHRRMVCVSFSASSVSLAVDSNNDNVACDNPLSLPGSASATALSGDAGKAYFNPVPANFNFSSDGTSGGAVIQIANQPPIVVVGATGYVD